jgi:Uma2 family endonuclease
MEMEALLDYQKSELIDGVVYNMSPASIKHIRIQRRLSIIIGNFLRGKRCEVFSEAEVRLDENNKFIPDLCIICTPSQVKTSYIEGAPDFVVEILSPSTRKKDLTAKKSAYEKFGVKEYWIIDPKGESIDAYLLKDGKFELDSTCHNIPEEELAEMHEEDREKIQLALKISLYDELTITAKEVFED